MKYLATTAVTAELNYVKNNVNKILAVLVANPADITYATLTAPANVIAEAALTPADLAVSVAADFTCALTLAAGKQDAAANNAGDPTHFVLVNTTNSEVILIVPETSAVAPTAGQVVTFPSTILTVPPLV